LSPKIDRSWSGTDKPPLPGNCETLIQSAVPAHVIDKGIPTTGLLASVLVAK
jgi:transposase